MIIGVLFYINLSNNLILDTLPPGITNIIISYVNNYEFFQENINIIEQKLLNIRQKYITAIFILDMNKIFCINYKITKLFEYIICDSYTNNDIPPFNGQIISKSTIQKNSNNIITNNYIYDSMNNILDFTALFHSNNNLLLWNKVLLGESNSLIYYPIPQIYDLLLLLNSALISNDLYKKIDIIKNIIKIEKYFFSLDISKQVLILAGNQDNQFNNYAKNIIKNIIL